MTSFSNDRKRKELSWESRLPDHLFPFKMLKRSNYGLIVIFFVATLIYANIFDAPFHFDDNTLLLRNLTLKNLTAFVDHWRGNVWILRKIPTLFTFALNYHFFGQNAMSYHIINVILHVFTAFLLYLSLLKLGETTALKASSYGREKGIFSLFVALIFVSHPLQTQAVTYVWQRSEVLSGLFFMASYYLWLLGRLGNKKYYVFSLFIFVVGMFDKGTILSLPLILILTEMSFFRNDDGRRSCLVKSRPLFLFLIFLFILFHVSFNPLRTAVSFYHGLFMKLTSVHLSYIYFLTQFRVIPQYIRLCFFPVGQSIDHYFPVWDTGWNWPTVLSFIFVVFVVGIAFYFYRKRPLRSFGIFWFLICLLPTSFVSKEPFWEHRLYLSIAGFGILVMTLVHDFLKKRKIRYSICILIVCVFALLTVSRNYLWRDPVRLMKDAVKKAPMNARAQLGLGTVYSVKGDYKNAMRHYNEAIRLNPKSYKAYNNLGIIYKDMGNFRKAIPLFQKTIYLKDDFDLPYINLAYTYISMGKINQAQGLLEKAMTIKKSDMLYRAMGVLQTRRGNLGLAKSSFEKSLQLNPTSKEAYSNLGDVYYLGGNLLLAIEMYKKSLTIDPDFHKAIANLGSAYYRLGDLKRAKTYFEKAVAMRPNNLIFKDLAKICYSLKEYDKAKEYYEKGRVMYSPYLRLH